ncbi:MAG TPA: DUF1269 domain-containing protein [Planktothrix sp.]|jgi:uncharacterized membrane protein
MSDLIVVAYPDEHKAEEVRLTLIKLQQEYLIDLEDAVIAVKKPDGKIRLNQAVNQTELGAVRGSFWGLLIGAMFLSPFLGGFIGAGSGALAGALSDVGIDDNFMKLVANQLQPGTSALFVLLRKVTPDKVAEHLQGMGGKILQTSLSHENEQKLQEVLDGVKKVSQPA